LLVTVGVVYNRVGSSIRLASSILLDGENISFDASLVAVSDNRTSGVRDSRQIRVTALPNWRILTAFLKMQVLYDVILCRWESTSVSKGVPSLEKSKSVCPLTQHHVTQDLQFAVLMSFYQQRPIMQLCLYFR